MIEGKIANYQHGRSFFTDGSTCSQCAGDHTIDTTSATIAHNTYFTTARPEEGIHVAYRHTIANIERRPLRNNIGKLCKDATLKERLKVLYCRLERLLCRGIGLLPR